jgi:predicted short-subunit dehydrogenase-like oxidoreductase (DUF2520 family)
VKPRLNIIGCGRAAGSLARLWLEADTVRIGDICNREPASGIRSVERLGAGTAVGAIAEMRAAPVWMIGTNDHQIQGVAMRLAERGAVDGDCLVFHLAGRFGLSVLQPLEASGARLVALHPVRSLTHNRLVLDDFRGTACVAEGEADALGRLRPLIEAIGGRWMPVGHVDRGLYHAALSVVSNVTKGVAWKAQKWLESAGLPDETSAALTNQLLQSTTQDLLRFGASRSITGPIVRGDTSTVDAHLRAVEEAHPQDAEIYQVFMRTVFELAQERGDLDEATLERLAELLGGR